MRDLTVRDLIQLVSADLRNGEDHLERMFEWHFERSMTAVKFILGGAGSLLAGMLLAVFKAELRMPLWQVSLGVIGGLGTVVYGIHRFRALGGIHRDYVAALQLYRRLVQFRPFIERYWASLR